MGNEIIRVRNASYSKYEELLIHREDLRKQAYQYERAYEREFGDLILELFNIRLKCIRKKMTIEFCQVFVNRGESVDQDALQEHLEIELGDYNKRLKEMIRENEALKAAERVTEADMLKIRRIYHRLVKKIHPDINPVTANNGELKDLWQRLIIAYKCNDLKEMEETEILVNLLLDKLMPDTMEITINDIDGKITEIESEIEKIKSTDPYQYKFLLEDITAVSEKRAELRREIKEYETYEKQLDEILDELLRGGVSIIWRMN